MKIKVTARKYEGDDRYSWAVFRSDQAVPVVTGLGKSEVTYYKNQVMKMIEEKRITPTEDEIELFQRAFCATIQAIGHDAGLEGADTFTIMEVGLDADYVGTYGHLTKEQYQKFSAWIQQELHDAKTMKQGYMKLAKILWYS